MSNLAPARPGPSPSEAFARAAYGLLARVPAPSALATRMTTPGTYEAYTHERLHFLLDRAAVPGSWFVPHAPAGGTVLLLHGALTFALPPYAHCVEALLARGLRVLAIELDGHGENPRAFTAQGVAECAPAALRYLYGRPDVDAGRVGMLGVSLGGACALHAMANDPAVKAAVTVCTPLELKPGHPVQQALEFSGVATPGGLQMLAAMPAQHLMAFLEETMRVEGGALHMLDPRTPVAVNEAVRHLDPLGSAAALGDRPYMAVHGEWDTVAPADHARALHARASGPRELVVSAMRNHFTIMWCPRAMGAAADFLAKHLHA